MRPTRTGTTVTFMVREDVAFLAALQLSDSALPVGRLVHSYGLESWLAANPSADAAAIAELVETTVIESVGPLDGVLVAHAHQAMTSDALIALDVLATASKSTSPAREASASCGRRLARVAARLVEPDALLAPYLEAVRSGSSDGNLAVVEGAVARALGISRRDAVLLEVRGAASALLSAAVRLGRLSALPAQTILVELHGAIAETAAAALLADLEGLRSNAGELEIAALARAHARLFTT